MPHELPPPKYPDGQNHSKHLQKLLVITSKLQNIMLAENITPNELVGCARVVRKNHQEFEMMSRTSTKPQQNSTPESDKPVLYCSFCGKKQREVVRMILGQGNICICNECVDLCDEILCREG